MLRPFLFWFAGNNHLDQRRNDCGDEEIIPQLDAEPALKNNGAERFGIFH